MRELKFLIFVIFINFLLFNLAYTQELGKITGIQGNVDILKGGKPPAIPAKVNEPIFLRDIIRTKTDSRAEITLIDGTVIRIAPRSRVDISEYFTDGNDIRAVVNVPRGKVGAFVAKESVEKIKMLPKSNKFEIRTPIAVAGVRGTNYIVAHYPDYSKVTVITGKVYCYNSQIPEILVEVKTGQSTIIRKGKPPTPPVEVSSEEINREQSDLNLFIKREIRKHSFIESFSESTIPTLEPKRENLSSIIQETSTKEIRPPITETSKSRSPLNVNFMIQSIEPITLGEWRVKYRVEANNPVFVQYKIEMDSGWSRWIDVNTIPQRNVDFSVTVSGEYRIHIKAKEAYGKAKNWISSLSPISEVFVGDIVSNSHMETVNGLVAGALGINRGVAKLNISSPVSFVSKFEAGGGDSTEGYWIMKGSPSFSSFRLIDSEYYFRGDGPCSVTLEDGYIKSITTEPWIETIKLYHISKILPGENSKIYSNDLTLTNANFEAYFGGDNFWRKGKGSLYLVGQINDTCDEINFSDSKGYLWLSPISWNSDSKRYRGYIGGRISPKLDNSYNMNAYVAGIYNNSEEKGIFIGELSTDASSNVLSTLERFYLDGENTVKAVTINKGLISDSPVQISITDLEIDPNSGITLRNSESYMEMDSTDYTFGVGFIGIGGMYGNVPSVPWQINYSGKFRGEGVFEAILLADVWGNDNNLINVIHGKSYGYFSDPTFAKTGIFVGETVGTFDPTKNWQAITLGVTIETAQFLSMACPGGVCNKLGGDFTESQEKLRKLNIPVVEVGRASFSGSGNNLEVYMRDVVFFSTQTGQKPILWSTANVSGTYSGDPQLNTSVTLLAKSGASGSINFTPTYWSGGNWAATILGSPELSGGSYSGEVKMQGVAGGKYGNGGFSGTASGIIK